MPNLSAAGLSGLQAREDINGNVLLAGNCSVDPRGMRPAAAILARVGRG